jgi:hypothetical protein
MAENIQQEAKTPFEKREEGTEITDSRSPEPSWAPLP